MYQLSNFDKIFAFYKKNLIKSSLYSLIPFRVSQVSSAHLCGFSPGPTLRGSSGRVVGNVWEIWSAQDLNPLSSAPEADVLLLVSSGWLFFAFISG